MLVSRGDRAVVRGVVENQSSRLSDVSFSKLVDQAEKDGALAEKVGLAARHPAAACSVIFCSRRPTLVQQRLFAAAGPETQAEIRRVLAKVSTEIGAKPAPRDYSAAQRAVEALRQAGKLDEAALVEFAQRSGTRKPSRRSRRCARCRSRSWTA